jgi:hypothetical protein
VSAYPGRKWLEDLDAGIAPFVSVLNAAGIETFESCEGGDNHAYPEPGIRFYGERSEGFRALAVATQHRFPVSELRRSWTVDKSGEPTGPHWELVFSRPATLEEFQAAKSQAAHIFQLRANAGRDLIERGLAVGSRPDEVAA